MFVKDQIQQCFNVSSVPIEIIRNSLSRNEFYPNDTKKRDFRKKYGIDDDEVILCFVSTNHSLKGLDYLLDALRLLKDKNDKFKLLIAGSGSKKYFKKRIKKLGLSNSVIMFGKLKNVREIYQASDIFVYPTLFDAFGNVALEAMYCGCVPLISKYCGSSEIAELADKNLIINDPTDHKEIYLKISTYLNDKKRKIVREKVENMILTLSQENVNEKIEDILKTHCN